MIYVYEYNVNELIITDIGIYKPEPIAQFSEANQIIQYLLYEVNINKKCEIWVKEYGIIQTVKSLTIKQIHDLF
jgi:hypothetical protein